MNRASPLSLRQFSWLSLSVFAAIAPHLARFALPMAVFMLLALLTRFIQRRYWPKPVSIAIKLPLTLLLPIWIVLQYGNVFGREPGSALACSMLVLKLIESERLRDAHAIILFASFVLMSALLFVQSLWFTLVLCSCLILFLATLRELQPKTKTANPTSKRWPREMQKTLTSATVSLLCALPIAVCAFAFLPRLSTPLWGAPSAGEGAHTGIDDRMTPGSIAELLVDDSPAFRVHFDHEPPPVQQRYWRGPVLTRFDGSTWSHVESLELEAKSDTIASAATIVEYEVTLDATQQRWLFALDLPLSTPSDAVRGNDMMLTAHQPITQPRQYHMRSALSYRLEPALSQRHRVQALQLPNGFNPRSRELAAQWRASAGDDESLMRKALALFHASFSYTLNPPLLKHDSVDDFLFSTRKGYCEHFASAFVFLMRAAGIPARVVTGYQGGYFNDVGNYLVVRQSDAHAWAEIWLADKGWVRVDPTAAVSPERIEAGASAANAADAAWYRPEWLLRWRNRLDLVNQLWNSSIIQFNALRQASLLQPLGIEYAGYRELVATLAIGMTVIFSLFAGWALYRPRPRNDPLQTAYARFCSKLARFGITRQTNEGPADFAYRAANAIPNLAAPITTLSAMYIGLRYALMRPTDKAVLEYVSAVRAWRLPRFRVTQRGAPNRG